jgi:LCP family protein required for cell wall assembly
VVAQPRPPIASEGKPTVAAPAEAQPDLPEWSGTKRVNILLLGIDHRDDEPIDGSRSDTIMVVSIDPLSKSVVMVSLPRDLWVSIPGYFQQRINVAHSAGGPALVGRTIEANFGIRIDHFARINFRGFEEIVDAVGGVIVDAERTIKDDEYPTEDYGVMRLFIPPGPQHMDGRTALQYARSRHSENDFGRARRQQRVLMALRDRGLQLNILPKVPSLIGLVQKAIQTDVGVTDMLALARLGSEIERDRIKSVVVDVNLADPFVGSSGEDLLMPRRADIQRAITRAFAEASGQTARVEVLNGTNRAGIARSLGDQLRRRAHRHGRPHRLQRHVLGDPERGSAGGHDAGGSAAAAPVGRPARAGAEQPGRHQDHPR